MERIIGGKFKLGEKIGSGSFGELYVGVNIENGEKVALKLEPLKSSNPLLHYEAKVYALLQGESGVPKLKWFGVYGEYNIMAIDLLGPSLEDLFNLCDRRFSLKTVLLLADQLITRVEHMHSKGFLHRDIKPDNFLMGLGRATQVYIIDYGLAKKYRDHQTRKHIPYRENKSLTGTARYASINIHLGIEPSRRDDLESLGYVLMYFLRGSLPWQGLQATTKKQKYDKIRQKKILTPIEGLCESCPPEFALYFRHCRSLGFEGKPNYSYLRRLFSDLYVRQGYQFDFIFDWNMKHSQINVNPRQQPGDKTGRATNHKFPDNAFSLLKQTVDSEKICPTSHNESASKKVAVPSSRNHVVSTGSQPSSSQQRVQQQSVIASGSSRAFRPAVTRGTCNEPFLRKFDFLSLENKMHK
ncbi:casein kinase 1-like protein 10 [Zingiber officinale]|uniref:non-specific serine/threonine protein kinase n=1 Tax=Zingiber officinale TaxID=94328 RepID=A0A8J5KIW0_ZINOF|nr:casein kinase 1-like protein 10 [Zingiber officinale]XP_042423674.1 casein kinase 1-like protein 10 [Zingiber officinale]KAG6485253.1 hypothetical protein ZIOFF_053787 [Zingiber officinale]